MWFLVRILQGGEFRRICISVRNREEEDRGGLEAYLFTLYPTSGALTRNEIHCPESKKQRVKKAWASISGRTN